MSEFTVLDERPITLVELQARLKEFGKPEDLSFRANKTREYLDNFNMLSIKDMEKFREEIVNLNIPRLKERHITKILDVMPKDLDSIKLLLSGETLTISDDDLKKILDVIPQ